MNKEAILRAADWLEANRDKHITGDLATNAEGRLRSPFDPDAECFCALGRIAYEIGPDHPQWRDDIREIAMAMVGLAADLPNYSMVYKLNDAPARTPLGAIDRLPNNHPRGNAKVIAYLREVAA